MELSKETLDIERNPSQTWQEDDGTEADSSSRRKDQMNVNGINTKSNESRNIEWYLLLVWIHAGQLAVGPGVVRHVFEVPQSFESVDVVHIFKVS